VTKIEELRAVFDSAIRSKKLRIIDETSTVEIRDPNGFYSAVYFD